MKLTIRIATVALFTLLAIYITLQAVEISSQFSDNRRDTTTADIVFSVQRCTESPQPANTDARIFKDGREVRHIAFLKIHKAASGTATSIFFRYGTTHDLTFVLPKFLNSISSYGTVDEKNIYPRLNRSFDIMTSHVIYNREAFERYMPADTVYIGILREPYQQFKSSMNYMAPKYVYNISNDDPIQQFLKNPAKYEPTSPRNSWINNRQSSEFGLPDEVIVNRNVSALNKYIQKLDKEFHLVIIAEYFDESVVLMRRMLNWKLEDIFYRRLHIRGWDRKLTLPRPNDRKLFRQYAFADYALYDFFFNRLWLQAKQAGDDFFYEVLWYKQVRDEVEDYCKIYPNMTETYTVPKSKWNDDLVIDKPFCKLLMSEEEDFVEQIGLKQYNIKPKPKK